MTRQTQIAELNHRELARGIESLLIRMESLRLRITLPGTELTE